MISSKNDNNFDTQGHRGCRALMPENTIPAMLKAIDLGVKTLELDVVITKDEQVVVSHDPFFNYEISSKPNGEPVALSEESSFNLYHMTYQETTAFDVGLRPHPRFPLQKKIRISKPLLSDLIDAVEAYCIDKRLSPRYYNIETKCRLETDLIFHPAPKKFVSLLMDVIIQKKIAKRTIIQSFDVRSLQEIHTRHPDLQTSLLIDEHNNSSVAKNIELLGFVPKIYSPHYALVTPLLIEQCHRKQMRVIAWTVNDKKQIDALKRLGVDGIISDDPQLFGIR